MIERKFKKVNRKVNGVVTSVLKEGVNGTGVTLPFSCGFCRDENGDATAAFRTQKERNQHAQRCPA
jgi:hypothetical protein